MKPAFIKRILTACVAGALLLSTMAMSALGTNINDPEFEMTLTGTRTARPDLFGSKTKNMMPGDSVSFNVVLKNGVANNTMDLYMRAQETVKDYDGSAFEGAAKQLSDELLAVLRMKITRIDTGAVIYEGTVDGKTPQTGRRDLYLPNNDTHPNPNNTTVFVPLGQLSNGGSTSIRVEITVPVNIDSKFQGARALTDWQFGWNATEVVTSSSSGVTSTTGREPFESRPGGGGGGSNPTANIDSSSVPVTVITDDITDPTTPLENVIVIEIPDEKLPLTGTLGIIMSNSAALSAVVLVLMGTCIITVIKLRQQRAKG